MPIIVQLYEDGPIYPGKYEICWRCRGTGTHVNPAIDGNGLSAQDWNELGEEFREDYLNGAHDVACEECKGGGKLLVPDEERMTPEQIREVHERYQAEAEIAAEREAERRMGA